MADQTRCVVCGSVVGKRDFECETCSRSYCRLHVGTNVKYTCSRCDATHTQEIALKFNERCPTVTDSTCPRCKSSLYLDKQPSGHLYLSCSKCDWDSFKYQPMILYQSQNIVLSEAAKRGLVQKNSRVCSGRLKESGGEEFCPHCLVDEIKALKTASFSTIAEMTKMDADDVPALLEMLIRDFKLNGVIDKHNRLFTHVPTNFRKDLNEQIKKEGYIIIEDLATKLNIDKNQALTLMYDIIRTERMRGTFTRDKKRYYTSIYIQGFLMDVAKNDGVITIVEVANRLDIHKEIIKDHIETLLKTKQIDAFFAGKGSVVYTRSRMQELILNHAKETKKFKLESAAKKFNVTIELVRSALHELVKKGMIRGIFTQKREYMTDIALKEEIIRIVRAYRTISLSDLARRLGITERTVEESLASLITRGDISGYIDLKTREFKLESLAPSVEGRTGTASTLASKAAAGQGDTGIPKHDENFVEVVREYDYVGGQVHFKIAVRNNSNAAIYDIKVVLDYPDAFQIEEEMISVPVIEPESSRGIDFYLEPTTCGKSHVGGTVIYKDYTSKVHTIHVREKEIWIKCPLVVSTMDTLEDVNQVIKSLPSDARSFLISDIDARLAYHAGFRAVSHFDTRCVAAPEKLEGEMFEAEAFFATKAKNGGRIVIKLTVSERSQILELRIWCAEAGQLTGLLAKIIEYLFQEINIIRKIKAESREKTVDLMAIAQGITVLSDYVMLRWKISDIATKLEDIYARVMKFLKSDAIIDEMEQWLEKLRSLNEDLNIAPEMADDLGDDIERWQDVIQRSISPA
ncbi:DUF2042 domain-containing protein [Candidatus Bathyarchaeota archaeon]|nr:DUF2042 domain-containing protein [Candidatus Bathyarchaeota archaeon]